MSIDSLTLPRRLVLCAPLLTLLVACSSATPPAAADTQTPPAVASSPQTLMREIEAETANAACTSDAQCHTLPVGAKACGGPERYIPYSSAGSNADRLAALSQAYAQARREQHAGGGMLSTCSIVPDPGAACRAGQCVLRDAAPAS
ncbi:hypothetical protein OOT46_24885 [Aquabacterium sp. A7-Y]|uniref:hypothetical protein n=1 Tax=Aquabacterium sp. A7-Y TaxID=1349605 RepID=UPI00223E75AC|nr:hypothetical protein [Aquabacterium sp. A7-Y]MCW7541058.1 hypothetical protein [Aquabacterium sp. A7-Y]